MAFFIPYFTFRCKLYAVHLRGILELIPDECIALESIAGRDVTALQSELFYSQFVML